jgi:hypothetical protein
VTANAEAVLDAGRGTLTLPRRLVPTVMLLRAKGRAGFAGDASSVRALAELERAGITAAGRLHPLAADILQVVTDPSLVVTVEVRALERPAISTIWASDAGAVLGQAIEPGLFHLGPIEPDLLPFHLAQLTMVGPRPDHGFAGSADAPAGLLDELEPLWCTDPDAVAARLVGAGVGAAWAERLAGAHRHRRATWRVASLWAGPDGSAHDREVMMLDAGPEGYWEITPLPADVPSIRFTPRRFADVMEALTAAAPHLR